MDEENNITTIQISKTTRERVASIGMKGETYDEILNNLIDLWIKNKK